MNPLELCKLIAEYVERNAVKGKARDRVAHAVAFGAYSVLNAQGAEPNCSGITFLIGTRGYAAVTDYIERHAQRHVTGKENQ